MSNTEKNIVRAGVVGLGLYGASIVVAMTGMGIKWNATPHSQMDQIGSYFLDSAVAAAGIGVFLLAGALIYFNRRYPAADAQNPDTPKSCLVSI